MDPTRTGDHFETWVLTDPLDVNSAKRRDEIPAMKRLEALAYWRDRGFHSAKLNEHEYTLHDQVRHRSR